MSRNSVQREAILKMVINNFSHPAADWVYDQVKKEIPNISLGTVYRNLSLLVKDGKIAALYFPGGPVRFDGNTLTHYHIICQKCGSILDLDEPVDFTLEYRAARKTGFAVFKHNLDFTGLCPDCQNDKG